MINSAPNQTPVGEMPRVIVPVGLPSAILPRADSDKNIRTIEMKACTESSKMGLTAVGATAENDNDESSQSSRNARIALWRPGRKRGIPRKRCGGQTNIDGRDIAIALAPNQPRWVRQMRLPFRDRRGIPNKNETDQNKRWRPRIKETANDEEEHGNASSAPPQSPREALQQPPPSSFLPTIHTPDPYGYELGIRLYTNDEGYFSAPLPNSCLKQFQCDYDSSYDSSFAPSMVSGDTMSTYSIEQEQRGTEAESRRDILTILEKCHREYISPPDANDLKKMFCGLHKLEKEVEQNMDNCGVVIRLATIQIRPDVTCECVMDAVERAICTDTGSVQKKEKGRIRVFLPLLPPYFSGIPKASDGSSLDTRQVEKDQRNQIFCLDSQLCTKKMSRNCERVLLIQISSVGIDVTDDSGITNFSENKETGSGGEDEEQDSLEFMAQFLLANIDKKEEHQAAEHSPSETNNGLKHENGMSFDKSLRSLFKSSTSCSTLTNASTLSLRNMFSLNGEDLGLELEEEVPGRNKHKYPCLVETYHPIIQAGWKAISDIIQELEDCRLAYCTLYNFRFGEPPAIPSIDEHYLYQLKSLHQDDISSSSLTCASELESRAHDVEYGCTNLFKLLLRTFDLYGIAPPDPPNVTSETAYPLYLNSPCASDPPWGRLGMPAMEKISGIINQESPLVKNGFKNTIKGVRMISSAFQRQDFEKQDDILNKMNVRVWERLSKTLDHAKECVALLSGSFGSNAQSTEAAADFFSKALRAKHLSAKSCTSSLNQEVPLLICDTTLASCKRGGRITSIHGTCYITEKNILLVSKRAIFQGRNKSFLMDIAQIELKVWKNFRNKRSARKLLDQCSEFSGFICIVMKDQVLGKEDTIGEDDESEDSGIVADFSSAELVSFVPSIGSKRFKYFVDMIRGVQDPKESTIKKCFQPSIGSS